jgi:hypothetical protein
MKQSILMVLVLLTGSLFHPTYYNSTKRIHPTSSSCLLLIKTVVCSALDRSKAITFIREDGRPRAWQGTEGRANLCGGWVTFWFGFRLDLTVQFSDVIFLIYLASGVQQSATRCDFESDDLCGWVQDTRTDEFDWTWQNYGTPSFHLGTGPSFDHTLGQGKAGQLLS